MTGAQRIDVEFVLARSAVGGAFAVIVTEEDVAQGKPDPEGFLLAQQLMDVDPHACLVFEDSLHRLAAARAAGTRTIGLVGTRTAEQLAHAADAVVAHLSPSLLSVLD